MTTRNIHALQPFPELNSRIWHLSHHHSLPLLSASLSSRSSKILNTTTDEIIATLDDTHTRSVRASSWKPISEPLLATASFDGTVGIWEHWDCTATLEGHENEVKSVSWNSRGDLLASCSRDKSVWIWEVDDENEYDCIAVLQDHTADVKSVLFHPTEDILLSCSYDDSIRVYIDDDGDWGCIQKISAHDSTVWGLAFNEDGTCFASCSADGTVKIWSTDDYTHVCTLPAIHQGAVYSVSWNGTGLLSTGEDGRVVWYTAAAEGEWQISGTREMAHGMFEVNCVVWSPGTANKFFTGGDDGVVRCWTVE